MSKLNIEKIIRTYFHSHFSESTRRKFAWWMVNSSDEDKAKDEAMQHLWEESMAGIDMQTLNDLEALKSRIGYNNSTTDQPSKRRKYWSAAAAIGLMAVLAVASYFIESSRSDMGDEFVHISVPYGQTKFLCLEDSTRVTINAGTTLIYPRRFGKGKRNVFLSGEANFDVTRDEKRPFTVETQSINVTALGTKFEVQAYPDARTVSTVLEEGRTKVVIVEAEAKTSGHTYIMSPNQNLVYNKATGEVSVTEIDASRRLSWEKGNLIFEGEDFKTILQALERKYNVTIICDHIERMNGKFFVKFRADETLHDALDILGNLSQRFTYREEGDTIYLSPTK